MKEEDSKRPLNNESLAIIEKLLSEFDENVDEIKRVMENFIEKTNRRKKD